MRAVSLCVLLVAALAHGAAVDINISGKTEAFPHYWKRCVGSGHMLLGTRSDWRAHMQKVRNELGFVGVRGHGILDDDMSVIIDGEYHFYNVDQVYDFLLSIGVRPIVELSFMPRALARCTRATCDYAFNDPVGGYKGLVMPPVDFNDWYKLVRALTQHLLERYGLEEISQWHFEVWNEMWGMDYPGNYMQLYNASALAVKAVHPTLKIGGPATMQVQYVADFIERAKQASLPVDFVSTHFYPSDPACTDEPAGRNDPDCFANTVLGAYNATAAAGLPFYLTEYNDGLEGGDHRDKAYAAAFLLHNIPLLRALDVFSFWTLTDIFEEGGLRSDPFSNAYGIQNIYGIAKPVYRAFQQLADAGDQLASVTVTNSSGVTAFATTVSASPHEALHGARIFITNFKRHEMPLDLDTVTLLIHHAAGAPVPAAAALTIIDSTHCDPRGVWESMGSPQYPTAAQLAQLDQASKLVETSVPLTVVSPTTLSLQLRLEPYASAFVHF